MRITSVAGISVQACATFEYKGYIISMSTIFLNCSVAVFNTPTGLPVHETNTVEDAIDWILTQTN